MATHTSLEMGLPEVLDQTCLPFIGRPPGEHDVLARLWWDSPMTNWRQAASHGEHSTDGRKVEGLSAVCQARDYSIQKTVPSELSCTACQLELCP
jgi:hypothetical protein